ncbi:hypothetical protein BaRGS_00024010, partial [Batillaria attramentaria]
MRAGEGGGTAVWLNAAKLLSEAMPMGLFSRLCPCLSVPRGDVRVRGEAALEMSISFSWKGEELISTLTCLYTG